MLFLWLRFLAEAVVLAVFICTKIPSLHFKLGFLWLNPIGAFGVILFSLLLNGIMKKNSGVAGNSSISQMNTDS